MDLAKLNVWVDDVLGRGWESTKVDPASILLKCCKLTLGGITRRGMVMRNMMSDLDPSPPTPTETYSEKCQPPLEILEHAIEQVRQSLDSFEASKRLLNEEECIVLGADMGLCWDDDQGYEGIESVPQVELLSMVGGEENQSLIIPCPEDFEQHQRGIDEVGEFIEGADMGGQGEFQIRNTLGKPPSYYPSTLEATASEGVVKTPSTCEGESGPRALTATQKLYPLVKMEFEARTHKEYTSNTKHSGIVDTNMSPMKVTLDQKMNPYPGLSPKPITLKEAIPLEDSREWRNLNGRAALGGCVMCDTKEGLKFHNFTPHFHHYSLIKLMICLTHLGGIAYAQEVNVDYGAGQLDINLGADQGTAANDKENQVMAEGLLPIDKVVPNVMDSELVVDRSNMVQKLKSTSSQAGEDAAGASPRHLCGEIKPPQPQTMTPKESKEHQYNSLFSHLTGYIGGNNGLRSCPWINVIRGSFESLQQVLQKVPRKFPQNPNQTRTIQPVKHPPETQGTNIHRAECVSPVMAVV